MAIKIDWNKVEDSIEFKVIPEGDYDAEIVDVKEKTTKNDDEMWSIKFQILNGDYKGSFVSTNLVFNEKGLSNAKKLFSTLFGIKIPKAIESTDIMNEKCRIAVTIGEYNGKKTNNIPFAGFSEINDTDVIGEEEIPF